MTAEDSIVQLLTKDGLAGVLGFALAYILPHWGRWEPMPSFDKRAVVLIICLSVPILATLVGHYGLAMWADITIISRLVIAVEIGFAAFVGSQYGHARRDLLAKKGGK